MPRVSFQMKALLEALIKGSKIFLRRIILFDSRMIKFTAIILKFSIWIRSIGNSSHTTVGKSEKRFDFVLYRHLAVEFDY